MASNFSPWFNVHLEKLPKSWEPFDMLRSKPVPCTWFFTSLFFPFFLMFKIFGHKLMIQTVGNVPLPKHGYVAKFEPLIFLESRDICKKCIAINLHFWTYVGSSIMIWTADPLCNSKNEYGVKFQPVSMYILRKWLKTERRWICKGQNHCLPHDLSTVHFFHFLKIVCHKPMSKPLETFLSPNTAAFSNLSRWSFSNLKLFAKKSRTIYLHF